MRDFVRRNRVGIFFYALLTFIALVVNLWFGAALVVGVIARLYSGHVISITAGLAAGIIAVELVRLVTR
jgi:hypothetical protein